ncbi:hypothetical protein MLD38_035405 [Melastoma candidum]|uniref:Uncharacterized protein n=1 Tax=Melastoma candidum TaxID=119954 RepID=A0ACB9LGK1_9MYRT|nr:hypothetical protein MLD38_035405 [Melastoma candidum]
MQPRKEEEWIKWRQQRTTPRFPRIHLRPVLRVPNTPYSDHALSAMTSPDPIGVGLAIGAIVEAGSPDCIVPGLSAPVKMLGIEVTIPYSP